MVEIDGSKSNLWELENDSRSPSTKKLFIPADIDGAKTF
jgi:hypothetical protein